MTEPDVALTDFALAVECVALAVIVFRRKRQSGPVRRRIVALYLSIAAGAFLGGIYHGFLNSYDGVASKSVWTATLMSLGVTALFVWLIAAEFVLYRRWRRQIRNGAAVLFVFFALAVLFGTQSFLLAVLNLVPALILLLVGLIAEYRRAPETYLLVGLLAISLVFFSAVLQQLKVDLHPEYFTYNALYHVLQGLAFFMLFYCLGKLGDRVRAE